MGFVENTFFFLRMPTALGKRGIAYYEKGEIEKAIECFTLAIQVVPDWAYAYAYRGFLYGEQEVHDNAIADYAKAIEHQEDYDYAHIKRGESYFAKGDFENALKDCNEAVRIDSDNPRYFFTRGNVLLNLENCEDAISNYDQSIAIAPDADVYDYRGRANWLLGNLELAMNDFDKAIELNPEQVSAYIYRGIIHTSLGNLKDAIEDFQSALGIEADDYAALINLAIAYRNMKNFDAAISSLDQAINLYPNELEAYYHRGILSQFRGEYIEALDDYMKAFALDEEDAALHTVLFSAHMKLENNDNAQTHEKAARELFEKAKEDYYNRACLESLSGNIDEGLTLFKIAMEKVQESKMWAKEDPDLENLRADTRFWEIIGEEMP